MDKVEALLVHRKLERWLAALDGVANEPIAPNADTIDSLDDLFRSIARGDMRLQ
ncbi:MAG: hypothetical protein ACRD5M_02715 [Candidatus Acidiferrales bacterium]